MCNFKCKLGYHKLSLKIITKLSLNIWWLKPDVKNLTKSWIDLAQMIQALTNVAYAFGYAMRNGK